MEDSRGAKTAAFGTEDLEEEDVWAMMTSSEISKSKSKTKMYNSSSSSAWRRFTAAPRAIPRSTSGGGGGGTANSSAPVDIPDWDKILKKKTNKNLWDDECNNDDDAKNYEQIKFDDVGKYDDDDDDDNDEKIPPHEYLAKRLANTQIASFSMCEGVGRTLKGRDLSKLRNAILTKTGFLE